MKTLFNFNAKHRMKHFAQEYSQEYSHHRQNLFVKWYVSKPCFTSKVYEVENDDGKLLAMKCVPLEDLDDFVVESHCNEIEILWALRNSPYIIKLYEL